MCTPDMMAAARSIGKAREDMSIEGVNLNNLKDAPRKLALTTAAQFKPLGGITLGKIGVTDPTRQSQGYA
jgi:hypothetical protein